MLGSQARFESIINGYGFVPTRFIEGKSYYALITSMFLHGGMMHLSGNMLFLYIFGDNVEDMCGRSSYLSFYLLSGVGATLTHLVFNLGSKIPSVGASGAISGILGAYILLFPSARILTAVPFGWFVRLVYVPAYVMIGLWFLYQFLLAFLSVEAGVAYWAHIGGFVSGLLLIRLFAKRKREHPLIRRGVLRPYWA